MDVVEPWPLDQFPIRKMDEIKNDKYWQLFEQRLNEAYPSTLEYSAQRAEHVESVRSHAKNVLEHYWISKGKKNKKYMKYRNQSLAVFVQRLPFPSSDKGRRWDIAAMKQNPMSHELLLAIKFLVGESQLPPWASMALASQGYSHFEDPKVISQAEPEAATGGSVDAIEALNAHGNGFTPALANGAIQILAAIPTGTPSEMSASDAFSTPDTPTSTELGAADTTLDTTSCLAATQAIEAALENLAKAVRDHMVDEIRALEAEKEQLLAELAAVKAKHEVDRHMMDSVHKTMQAWAQMKGGD